MSSVPPIQDMPPQGGYSKINIARVPAKKSFKGIAFIGAFVATQLTVIYIKYNYAQPELRKRQLENRSARVVVFPFLEAEKDRAALLQLRRNRDVEEELMKNVEGWEAGTLMGEPVYKTVKENEWVMQHGYEYWAHANREDFDTTFGIEFRR